MKARLRSNLGLKFVSVLIAVALWVAVFGSRTVEITKEIPFEVQLAENQVLVDPVPDKILFRLSGPKAFLRTLQGRFEEPIRANLQNAVGGIVSYRILSDQFKAPFGVKVLSMTPNLVQIKVEELRTKIVNVIVETQGQLPSGHALMRTETLPMTARIRGPKSRIDSLGAIHALPIDLSQIRATTVMPLGFDLRALGVELDSVVPEANVEVMGPGVNLRVRHVPLRVQLGRKASAADTEVTLFVRTQHPEAKIDGSGFRAEVDARDLPPGDHLRWIRVSTPEGTDLLRVIPPFTHIFVKER